MIKIDLLTCHQDLIRGGCYYTLSTETTLQYTRVIFALRGLTVRQLTLASAKWQVLHCVT